MVQTRLMKSQGITSEDKIAADTLIQLHKDNSILKKLKDELKDIAQVDQEPSLEGRQLLMVLSPIKKKS